MDINDPFIQKALTGDCQKFRYREVKAFIERYPEEIGFKQSTEDKLKIYVKGLNSRDGVIPFIKIEKPHGGEKYIDKQYINGLINDLIRAGHIKQGDIK